MLPGVVRGAPHHRCRLRSSRSSWRMCKGGAMRVCIHQLQQTCGWQIYIVRWHQDPKQLSLTGSCSLGPYSLGQYSLGIQMLQLGTHSPQGFLQPAAAHLGAGWRVQAWLKVSELRFNYLRGSAGWGSLRSYRSASGFGIRTPNN